MLNTTINEAAFKGLAEPLQAEYTRQDDGSYALQLSGKTARETELEGKVAEFRTENINARKQKETAVRERDQAREQLSAFEGVDVEEYKTLKTHVADLKSKGIDKPEDITGHIQTAVEAAVKPLRDEVEASKQREADARKSAQAQTFRSTVTTAATEAGALPAAIPDIIQRAEGAGFVDHEGQMRIVVDGTPRFTADGSPYGLADWLAEQRRGGAPHLFQPSKGGGAPPKAGSGSGSGTGGDGVEILDNPSVMDMSKRIEDIAAGKVRVTRPTIPFPGAAVAGGNAGAGAQ